MLHVVVATAVIAGYYVNNAMNKILIDSPAFKALNTWAVEHAGLTKFSWNKPYFEDMEIRFSEIDMIAYSKCKKGIWKISVKIEGRIRIKIEITNPDSNDLDVMLQYKLVDANDLPQDLQSQERIDEIIEFISFAVLHINTYLIYGNAYEDRPVILTGKNDGNKKTIVFRLFEGKTYAVATTTHRSPEGIFSVRGHFRRYKSGKVIWIDEYLKGIEKEERNKK